MATIRENIMYVYIKSLVGDIWSEFKFADELEKQFAKENIRLLSEQQLWLIFVRGCQSLRDLLSEKSKFKESIESGEVLAEKLKPQFLSTLAEIVKEGK